MTGSAFVDPYFDYQNGVLRNLVSATTSEDLARIETDWTAKQILDIDSAGISRSNDLSEICAIHRFLFGKIYDWAGEIRTVDIYKNSADAQYFLIVSRISTAANYVFNKLAKENFLRGLTKTKFAQRLAYYYDQLNYIHPFREGNGRTQRVFWDRVAADAGYFIDWSKVATGENDSASKAAAENQDITLLIKMFDRIVEKN